MNPRLFIGPMSKEIVDAVIDFQWPLGLIPSRRQVDHESGYVNGWVTETFCNYVRSKTDKVLLVRDHGGPNQGYKVDNGIESFLIDCQNFDMIHIDPFKRFKAIKDAVNETLKFMRMGYKLTLILSLRLLQRRQSKPYHQRNLLLF